jgi:hypothetical protein
MTEKLIKKITWKEYELEFNAGSLQFENATFDGKKVYNLRQLKELHKMIHKAFDLIEEYGLHD